MKKLPLNELLPMVPSIVPAFKVQTLSEVTDYNHDLMNIPAAWRNSRGEGVKVAILDTGTPTHRDITVAGSTSFVPGYGLDLAGHGCVDASTIVFSDKTGFTTIEELYNSFDIQEYENTFEDGTRGWSKDVSKLGLHTLSKPAENRADTTTITHVHKVHVTGDVVVVVTKYGEKLRLTPWHKIPCTKRALGGRCHYSKYRADELTKRFAIPYTTDVSYSGGETQYVFGSERWMCLACGHVCAYDKERNCRTQCKVCGKSKWDRIIRKYELSTDLAYLVGLITTDGHCHWSPDTSSFVVISNTHKELLDRAREAAKAAGFNASDVIKKPPRKAGQQNYYVLRIQDKDLCEILHSAGLSGAKTYTCRVPVEIFKSKRNVMLAYLAGVIDGDGSITRTRGKLRITTVSSGFALDLRLLLTFLGAPAHVNTYKNYSFGRTTENTEFPVLNVTTEVLLQDLFKYVVHSDKRRNYTFNLNKKFKLKRGHIKDIYTEHVDEFFYDLTVSSDDHTYYTDKGYVSNTFCGGIIAATADNGVGIKGIAPDCQDYYGAVLDKYGSGSTRYLIEGIYWAVDVVNAQIINMSLGIPSNYYVDPALEKACAYAYSKGATLFAAAGNDSGEVNFPARFDTVIAVAAVDRKQKLADFSSRGPEVEFAAGGVDVFSTFLNNTYASMSGTSFSCPAVAAVGALIQSDFKKRTGLFLKPADLRDELRKIAYDVGPEGRDEEFGWGIPVFRKDQRVATKPKTQSFWKWLWNKIKIG